MKETVNNCLTRLQRWLLPTHCVLCGAGTAAGDLCDGCRSALPWIGPACVRCAAPLPGTPPDAVCGGCQRRPPAFDRALAAFRYAPPVDQLIHGLKYAHRLSHARVLADLLHAEIIGSGIPPPDRLMPVPLHPARLRSRGFNQTLEIARRLSQRLNVSLDYAGVRRIRNTPAQTALDYRARRRNVRKAFEVLGDVQDQSIALIDDVMTSGATVQELARVLKRAGASTVQVWVIARATH